MMRCVENDLCDIKSQAQAFPGKPLHPALLSKNPFSGLLQLEVDVHRVGIASAESRWQGVDSRHAVECGEDGLVHHRIAAGADDLSTRDCAVAFDLDFYCANKRFVLLENRCGLLPLTEEPVVNEFVIPTKLAGGSSRTSFAFAVGRRATTAGRCSRLACALACGFALTRRSRWLGGAG